MQYVLINEMPFFQCPILGMLQVTDSFCQRWVENSVEVYQVSRGFIKSLLPLLSQTFLSLIFTQTLIVTAACFD